MILNHLKVAWRNILKHPGYAILNISGLALGIAAAFVLFLFVLQETSYDKHYEDSNKIYRIASDFYNMGGFASTSEALYSWLKDDCKEVKLVSGVNRLGNEMLVEVDGVEYTEGRGLQVDSSFFRLFSFELLAGNPRQLMKNTNEVVLTERLARKYFDTTSPLGETILLGDEKTPYQVTGIVKNDKRKTHIKADLFVPLKLDEDSGWTSASIFVYVMLHDHATPDLLNQSLEHLKKAKIYPTFQNETSYESWASGSHRVEYFIQPLQDIYLGSKFRFDLSPGGNLQQVVLLGIIGLFLLIIAIVNYINFTTARASIRAKEVGVKKTLGANRKLLVAQFLSESVFTSIFAMIIAMGFAELLLKIFARITGTAIIDTIFTEWRHGLILLGFSLLTGLLAGIYPAFYLTKYRPVNILKGQFALTGNKGLRSGLVVFQFVIAVTLIIASLVVYRQLQFMQHSDKGFEQQGVLIVKNIKELGKQAEAFRQEIERSPQVVSTSFNDRMPAGNFLWMYTYQPPGMEESITLQTFPADENYIPTLGLRLTNGRNFSKNIASDSTAVIVNDAALGALGLVGKDPIGLEVNKGYRIVGVIQDFNFQSLRKSIEPAVMSFGAQGYRLAIKLKINQMSDFLNDLEGIWQKFSIKEPINYVFLDDNFAKLAKNEKMLGQAIAIFTVLAILIACLGLFGLAAFMMEQRTKEIGIRKVLGASMGSLLELLTVDFLKPILIALLIASPLAYFFMENWLQDFAYRIAVPWWVFLLAGLMAVGITLVTVSFHGIKTALMNPVDSLRNE